MQVLQNLRHTFQVHFSISCFKTFTSLPFGCICHSFRQSSSKALGDELSRGKVRPKLADWPVVFTGRGEGRGESVSHSTVNARCWTALCFLMKWFLFSLLAITIFYIQLVDSTSWLANINSTYRFKIVSDRDSTNYARNWVVVKTQHN